MLWFKLIRPSEEVPSQRQRAREETGGQPAGSDKLRSSADNSGLQNWQILPALIRSNQNRESALSREAEKREEKEARKLEWEENGRVANRHYLSFMGKNK